MSLENTLWWRSYCKWERYWEWKRIVEQRQQDCVDLLAEQFARAIDKMMVGSVDVGGGDCTGVTIFDEEGHVLDSFVVSRDETP